MFNKGENIRICLKPLDSNHGTTTSFHSCQAESLVWTICRGPVAVGAGVIYGLVVGFVLWLLQNVSKICRY